MDWAIERSDFLDTDDLFQRLYNVNINHNIKLYNKILILIECVMRMGSGGRREIKRNAQTVMFWGIWNS